MSLGKSKNSSDPGSVWSGQAPYLENLYAQGAQAMGRPGQYAQNYGQQVAGGAMGAFQNQAAGGGFAPIASGQMQNQYLSGAINAGLGDINRNLTRNMLPAINSGAAGTNTSGGSRQGIAQGLAISDANQQAADFVSRMQTQNYGTNLQAQLQGMAGQSQAQQSALNAAPQMSMLGAAPATAGYAQSFAGLNALQQLLGSPVVLGGGSRGTEWKTSAPQKPGI